MVGKGCYIGVNFLKFIYLCTLTDYFLGENKSSLWGKELGVRGADLYLLFINFLLGFVL